MFSGIPVERTIDEESCWESNGGWGCSKTVLHLEYDDNKYELPIKEGFVVPSPERCKEGDCKDKCGEDTTCVNQCVVECTAFPDIEESVLHLFLIAELDDKNELVIHKDPLGNLLGNLKEDKFYANSWLDEHGE